MTSSPSYVPRDIHEWSLQFWTQLARFVDGAHHHGLVGEARGQRVNVEATGAGDGLIRIEQLEEGTYREAARYSFQLADAPVAVAHVVAKLLGAHRRNVIDVMHLPDFLRTLQRAGHRTSVSVDDAVKLQKWAERLLPYMERNPTMTVGDVLAQYQADERAGRPRPDRPGSSQA